MPSRTRSTSSCIRSISRFLSPASRRARIIARMLRGISFSLRGGGGHEIVRELNHQLLKEFDRKRWLYRAITLFNALADLGDVFSDKHLMHHGSPVSWGWRIARRCGRR